MKEWNLNGYCKIDAIKKLRDFTKDTFGVSLGLKAAKDTVEELELNKVREAESAILNAIDIAKKAGVSWVVISNALSNY